MHCKLNLQDCSTGGDIQEASRCTARCQPAEVQGSAASLWGRASRTGVDIKTANRCGPRLRLIKDQLGCKDADKPTCGGKENKKKQGGDKHDSGSGNGKKEGGDRQYGGGGKDGDADVDADDDE